MRRARPSDGSGSSGTTVVPVGPTSQGELLVSPDGAVAFSLCRMGPRLFVQRTQRKAARVVAVQCLVIGDAENFRRWCDAEPIRFDHPIVFDRLRRYGDEVFAPGR
jgi:hypothetical protein